MAKRIFTDFIQRRAIFSCKIVIFKTRLYEIFLSRVDCKTLIPGLHDYSIMMKSPAIYGPAISQLFSYLMYGTLVKLSLLMSTFD